MLCTDRAEIAHKAQVLALHGMSADAWARFSDQGYRHYDVVHTGFKYNMTDVQGVLGLHQLAQIEGWLARREAIWERYDAEFADLPCTRPLPPEPDTVHARHLYTLLIDEAEAGLSRDEMLLALHRRGIGSGVHYRALHRQPYYRKHFGFRPEDYPNADYVGERTLSLPLSPHLEDSEVDRVIAATRAILQGGPR